MSHGFPRKPTHEPTDWSADLSTWMIDQAETFKIKCSLYIRVRPFNQKCIFTEGFISMIHIITIIFYKNIHWNGKGHRMFREQVLVLASWRIGRPRRWRGCCRSHQRWWSSPTSPRTLNATFIDESSKLNVINYVFEILWLNDFNCVSKSFRY